MALPSVAVQSGISLSMLEPSKCWSDSGAPEGTCGVFKEAAMCGPARPQSVRKHPAAGDRSVWDSSGGLLKPKVKRTHWFQNLNAEAFTHAHDIQVIRPGYTEGSWGPVYSSIGTGGGGGGPLHGRGTEKKKHRTGSDLEHKQHLSVMPATISILQ